MHNATMLLLSKNAQLAYLVWSVSHVVDVMGWRQHAILRRHKVGATDMALLLRAGRQGKVSFDDVRRQTRIPNHSISRAASRLKRRGLGTVKHDEPDRRRCRFHITPKGTDLLQTIELETAQRVLRDIGADSSGSKRYHDFTYWLWTVTRFLPAAGCDVKAYYAPVSTPISERAEPEEQIRFRQAYDDLSGGRKWPYDPVPS